MLHSINLRMFTPVPVTDLEFCDHQYVVCDVPFLCCGPKTDRRAGNDSVARREGPIRENAHGPESAIDISADPSSYNSFPIRVIFRALRVASGASLKGKSREKTNEKECQRSNYKLRIVHFGSIPPLFLINTSLLIIWRDGKYWYCHP